MDDLISRQDTIDRINEYIEEYSEIDSDGNHSEKWCAMQEAKMTIENMPSAQPEKRTEERTETHACDLIDRQAAIDVADAVWSVTGDKNVAKVWDQIKDLPSVQPDNQVHLCDSCKYTYPECPSGSKDVIYGNGKGNDNICACNKYEPSAQPELRRGES